MTKLEYKQHSHDIRTITRSYAAMQTELTGKKHTVRCCIHGLQWWTDGVYRCYGDYDTGLIWEKRWKL
jgi:hypothetical protein